MDPVRPKHDRGAAPRRNRMMTLAKKYRDQLVLALRAQEVSGDRVGEVLAEVEPHVAGTGEDPQEAFGPPRDYANHVVAQLGPDVVGVVPRWAERLQPRRGPARPRHRQTARGQARRRSAGHWRFDV